jgi:hypothetical protein
MRNADIFEKAISGYKDQLPDQIPVEKTTPEKMHKALVRLFFDDQKRLTEINHAKERLDQGDPQFITALYEQHILGNSRNQDAPYIQYKINRKKSRNIDLQA